MENINKIIVSSCRKYDSEEILKVLTTHIKKLNLFEKLKNSKKILIKPNLLGPHLPQEAVTTHPEFLKAVIKLSKTQPDKQIIVADSPSVLNFEEVVTKTGIKQVCQQEGVELVNLSTYPTVDFEFNKFNLKKITISKIIKEVDFIINLPKLKTHSLTILTCAVKNMYGLVPGMTKSVYHKYAPHPKDFLEIVYAIYNHARPDLTIVDGILGMEGDGPAGGEVRNFGVVISSIDALAVDWYILKHILKVSYFSFYKSSQLKPAEIIYEQIEEPLQFKKIKLPKTISILSKFPSWVLDILKNFIWFKPKIDQQLCVRCGKCYQICPQKTIKIINKNFKIFYDNCIYCFCCQETCPYKAIKTIRSPLYEFVLTIKDNLKQLLRW